MKTLLTAMIICLAALGARAQLLFSDSLNYPNGPLVGNGLWYTFNTNSTPGINAFVTNDLLILNSANNEDVAAPFTNTYSTTTYCSFTINVSSLPTTTGGYFFTFADTNNTTFGHVFVDTKGTVVPGTYRLGVANFATSISTALTTNFPMDLATGVTYQVVVSFDTILDATLQINPSSASDEFIYPTDQQASGSTAPGMASQVSFSQYSNQGIANIGNVVIGVGFSDVDTNTTPTTPPAIGIQPQSNTNYLNNSTVLYSAASGIDQTYQWYSNNVPLVDDGVTVVGSVSNILVLSNLQATATYTVVVTDAGGSTPSSNALVYVITTPTAPFFTLMPYGYTNSTGSSFSLTSAANGTGPIGYQWYYAPSNSLAFTNISTAKTSSYTVSQSTLATSGSYYVVASNSVSSTTSSIVKVLITPPQLVTIASIHPSLFVTNNNSFTLNGGTIYNIQGVVTSFGQVESKTACEFFIQDTNATPGTGGALVYIGSGAVPSNAPPAGSLVSIVGTVNEYYGELEVDPNLSSGANTFTVLSTPPTNNLALPVPAPVNFGQFATNAMGPYGITAQCSLLTMSNVYLYSSAIGGAVSGSFIAGSTKALYAFQHPYSAGQPYIEVYVYTYTNSPNGPVSSYGAQWAGQPIPSFAYQITGVMGLYATNSPNFFPTRIVDVVTNLPASFSSTVAVTNGTPTIGWPAVTGLTYSLYTATNVLGPWTKTSGLSYYPSTGSYVDTNSGPMKFYKVSTP